VKLKNYIFILLFLLSNLAIAQTFSYSYIDPCNGKTYKLDVPYGQNQIAVTYYGQVKSFTADDFNNGAFESWASGVFNQYQNASPCGGIGTAVTISQSQSTALTIVGIMNSLSALSDMANSGGSGNILAAAGSMNKANESKKNKNNSTSGGSTTNGTTVGNSNGGSGANASGTATSGGSTTNGNSTTTGDQNQGNGSSNTPGNSPTTGDNKSTTSNQGSGSNASGSGTTGGQNGTTTGTQNNTTTGNSQSSQPTVNGTSPSTTPNSGSPAGGTATSGGSTTGGSTTNGGSTASGGSGTKVSGDGSTEKPSDGSTPDNTTPAGEKKSDAMGGTVNAVKAVNKNGGKPSILLSSDLVGFQFKDNEITSGTKINSGYTSMRYDGLRTHGFLVDYTSSIKGPNVTAFYAWIKPKAITLLSNTFTIGRIGSGSLYNTVAFGQMRTLPYKIKAVYMITFSGGQIYKESYYGSAGIVGFNRDFKISKRVDVKAMALFVYAPFVRYYQDEVLKSPYVVLPIVGTNIGVTKKFKINVNFGGAYSMGDNVLNYTVMMGTRLAL
jgi:hypothetical protein